MSETPINGHANGGMGMSQSMANGSFAPPVAAPRQTYMDIPVLSRQKLAPADNEEADVVNSLGEFQQVPTLSHSECRLIINTVTDNRRTQAGGRRPDETGTMSKTRVWLDKFARFKTRDATMAVDQLLGGYGSRLDGFERSQIATLCPTDGDEAFTLIPSLKPKFTIAEMDELTRQVADLRTFE